MHNEYRIPFLIYLTGFGLSVIGWVLINLFKYQLYSAVGYDVAFQIAILSIIAPFFIANAIVLVRALNYKEITNVN
jgi:hypothetical protein